MSMYVCIYDNQRDCGIGRYEAHNMIFGVTLHTHIYIVPRIHSPHHGFPTATKVVCVLREIWRFHVPVRSQELPTAVMGLDDKGYS
jgi:hypothetical protein